MGTGILEMGSLEALNRTLQCWSTTPMGGWGDFGK